VDLLEKKLEPVMGDLDITMGAYCQVEDQLDARLYPITEDTIAEFSKLPNTLETRSRFENKLRADLESEAAKWAEDQNPAIFSVFSIDTVVDRAVLVAKTSLLLEFSVSVVKSLSLQHDTCNELAKLDTDQLESSRKGLAFIIYSALEHRLGFLLNTEGLSKVITNDSDMNRVLVCFYKFMTEITDLKDQFLIMEAQLSKSEKPISLTELMADSRVKLWQPTWGELSLLFEAAKITDYASQIKSIYHYCQQEEKTIKTATQVKSVVALQSNHPEPRKSMSAMLEKMVSKMKLDMLCLYLPKAKLSELKSLLAFARTIKNPGKSNIPNEMIMEILNRIFCVEEYIKTNAVSTSVSDPTYLSNLDSPENGRKDGSPPYMLYSDDDDLSADFGNVEPSYLGNFDSPESERKVSSPGYLLSDDE